MKLVETWRHSSGTCTLLVAVWLCSISSAGRQKVSTAGSDVSLLLLRSCPWLYVQNRCVIDLNPAEQVKGLMADILEKAFVGKQVRDRKLLTLAVIGAEWCHLANQCKLSLRWWLTTCGLSCSRSLSTAALPSPHGPAFNLEQNNSRCMFYEPFFFSGFLQIKSSGYDQCKLGALSRVCFAFSQAREPPQNLWSEYAPAFTAWLKWSTTTNGASSLYKCWESEQDVNTAVLFVIIDTDRNYVWWENFEFGFWMQDAHVSLSLNWFGLWLSEHKQL